jgi:hypothetical protein
MERLSPSGSTSQNSQVACLRAFHARSALTSIQLPFLMLDSRLKSRQ